MIITIAMIANTKANTNANANTKTNANTNTNAKKRATALKIGQPDGNNNCNDSARR